MYHFVSSAPWCQSDNFFKRCLKIISARDTNEVSCKSTELAADSDGFTADEFYVVLDQVYQYNANDDLDTLVKSSLQMRIMAQYLALKELCRTFHHDKFENVLTTSQYIRFIQLYDGISPVVKLCVTVKHDFGVDITVHGRPIPADHEIWSRVPSLCKSVTNIELILDVVSDYRVCTGNSDEKFQNLIPGLKTVTGTYFDITDETSHSAYQEHIAGVASIRSVGCNILIKKNELCKCCAVYRRTLTKAEFRKRNKELESPNKNWLKSTVGNTRLSETQKVQKLNQYRAYVSELQTKVDKLSKKLRNSIRQKAVILR